MPYKRRYRRRRKRVVRRRRKRKKKVSSMARIAKKVAQSVLKKQTESFSLVQMLGDKYTRFAAEYGSLISSGGLYDHDDKADRNVLLWGPQTVLAAVQAGGQIPGERMGREIFFTGLQCRLMLRLPQNCKSANITMRVCKTVTDSNYFARVDHIFGNPTLPWVKIKDLPERAEFKLVATKKFYLRHRYNAGNEGASSEIIRHVRFFIPIMKKVIYKETPSAPLECAKEDFLKGHYQVFFQSNAIPWDPNASNPVDQTKYPQVNGTLDWCYRDA